MENITLKIQYGNFLVEVSGPAEYAEKKLDELLKKYGNIQSAPSKLTKEKTSTENQQTKKVAPAEYIKKASPKSQADRALLLGYYLETQNGKENFTTNDLKEINKNAKQTPFTNISDTVAKLVKQGMMMGSGNVDGTRAFALTTTGEEAIEKLNSKATK
ncbi:MAG: hypothetical protein A2Z81_02755 [Omnitrophica WOR_2 bacterium GWA2_45_18]|nr:MAG: hypothetical protein A2Z81_02755 [Omnitrophica WOR_2 bacterium GWA2_45_18]